MWHWACAQGEIAAGGVKRRLGRRRAGHDGNGGGVRLSAERQGRNLYPGSHWLHRCL